MKIITLIFLLCFGCGPNRIVTPPTVISTNLSITDTLLNIINNLEDLEKATFVLSMLDHPVWPKPKTIEEAITRLKRYILGATSPEAMTMVEKAFRDADLIP